MCLSCPASEPPVFEEGKKVWLSAKNVQLKSKAAKLDNQKLGPFPIKAHILDWAYELELLSKVTEDEHRPFTKQPPPETFDGEEEYEVEAILDCKCEKGKRWYFVRWKGCGLESNQWEPQENLENSSELVKKFHGKQLKKAGDSTKGL